MAVQFPQNPAEGDQFVSGNVIFVFEDSKWVGASNSNVTLVPGATGPEGATGVAGPPGVSISGQRLGTATDVTGTDEMLLNETVGVDDLMRISVNDFMQDISVSTIVDRGLGARYGIDAGRDFDDATGTCNAIGKSAGLVGGNGSLRNDYFGSLAGQIHQGADNVFIGYRAGQNANVASQNTYVGSLAGQTLRGTSCSVYGYLAAGNVADTIKLGNEDLIMGFASGYNITNSANSVLLGARAGFELDSSVGNVVIGHQAMNVATAATTNVAIGQFAGGELRSGLSNVFLGGSAGAGFRGDNAGIFIGANAGGSANVGLDKYADGTLIIGTDHALPTTLSTTEGKYGIAAMSIGYGPYSYISGQLGLTDPNDPLSPARAYTFIPFLLADTLAVDQEFLAPKARVTDDTAGKYTLLALDNTTGIGITISPLPEQNRTKTKSEFSYTFDFAGVTDTTAGAFFDIDVEGACKIVTTGMVRAITDTNPTFDVQTWYYDGATITSPTVQGADGTGQTDSELLAASGLLFAYFRDDSAKTLSVRFASSTGTTLVGSAKLIVEVFYTPVLS